MYHYSMRGYILITNETAFSCHRRQKETNWVFCRKSEKPANLQPHDYVFFIAKGHLPRPIVGYAEVREVGSERVIDIWSKYGEKTSCLNIETLERRLGKNKDERVGYYEVTNVKYTDTNVSITDVEMGFAKDIQVGKFITEEQTKALLFSLDSRNKEGLNKYFPMITM